MDDLIDRCVANIDRVPVSLHVAFGGPTTFSIDTSVVFRINVHQVTQNP